MKRHLTPGRVLYVSCEFTNPRKNKYLVLLCPDTQPRPLLFVINSRISEYLRKRPHLLQCQVPISTKDYDWLHHDSYIDCSQVIEEVELASITSQMIEDVSRIKGELNSSTCCHILAVLQNAKTISKSHQQSIIEALRLKIGGEG